MVKDVGARELSLATTGLSSVDGFWLLAGRKTQRPWGPGPLGIWPNSSEYMANTKWTLGERVQGRGCPWKDWEVSMIGSTDDFQVVLKITLLKLSGQ